MDEQFAFLRLVVDRLNAAEIPYMLTGSIAMALYAEPRMTRDIDVVIECDIARADHLVRLFSADSYVSSEAAHEAVRTHGMFNIVHLDWLTKADLIVRKEQAYHLAEFARRRRVELGDFAVEAATPEDLILSKLLWSLDSGSERQLRDVRTLLDAGIPLEWAYVARWADELGVAGSLEKVRVL